VRAIADFDPASVTAPLQLEVWNCFSCHRLMQTILSSTIFLASSPQVRVR
jgi:hypothetical protein